MPERFRNMYDPEKITLPENWKTQHPFCYGIDLNSGEARDENLAAHPRTEREIRRHLADYYAMISHIDENVGRLLDTLEETGQLENTIIVYTGDNGLAVGCHGLMGKQRLYDHSVHVPLILSGPGIRRGAVSDAYVYLMDIYPTLCDLCGVPLPPSVEGKSFAAAAAGHRGSSREVLYFAYTHLIRGVQDDRYKLIRYRLAPDQTQLFDLQSDPHETVNLYSLPEYAPVRARMESLLLEQRDQYEDPPTPFTAAFWEPRQEAKASSPPKPKRRTFCKKPKKGIDKSPKSAII